MDLQDLIVFVGIDYLTRKYLRKGYFVVIGCLLVACSVPKKEQLIEEINEEVLRFEHNPPGKNFNTEESDSIAILLADQVMNAMGGRSAWDNTRYLHWNFFGSRKLLWDKKSGNVRIDFLKEDLKILMNTRNSTGRVLKNGQELLNEDSLSHYLSKGKSIWINDSYWLVMPFKLKDSGVRLKYLREDTTLAGKLADVISLTFQDVGDTPENKYEVWIDRETKLVTQWAYFLSFNDSLARFTLPWGNYQEMGGIRLSDDRGERDLSDVKVLETVPEAVFNTFEDVVL